MGREIIVGRKVAGFEGEDRGKKRKEEKRKDGVRRTGIKGEEKAKLSEKRRMYICGSRQRQAKTQRE